MNFSYYTSATDHETMQKNKNLQLRRGTGESVHKLNAGSDPPPRCSPGFLFRHKNVPRGTSQTVNMEFLHF